LANFARDGYARTGLKLKPASTRLLVTEIDSGWRRKTPAAQWNFNKENEVDDDDERMSHAIQPGDRIRSVNTAKSGNVKDMLEELRQAGSHAVPKKLGIRISRDISDILVPMHSALGSSRQLQTPQPLATVIESCNMPNKATLRDKKWAWLDSDDEASTRSSTRGSSASSCSQETTEGDTGLVDDGYQLLYQNAGGLRRPPSTKPSRPQMDISIGKFLQPGRVPSRCKCKACSRLRKGKISASSPVLMKGGLVAP
jgi:hypothetical protein